MSDLKVAVVGLGLGRHDVAAYVASECVGRLVVCDPDQHILREKLNRVGIESIGVKLPHAKYLLGGHHCTTLDTIRE